MPHFILRQRQASRRGTFTVAACVALFALACGGPTPDDNDPHDTDAGEQADAGELADGGRKGDAGGDLDAGGQVPSPPRGVEAVAGIGQATVTWTEPLTNGGRAVSGYVVTSSDGTSVESTKTSAVVDGLKNGTAYTFRVVARNAIGESAPSESSNEVTPATVPGPPSEVVAAVGMKSAHVSWNAPADDGGSPVTGYIVVASNGALRQTADTRLEFTGLVNGATYSFHVVAVNAMGQGAPSAESNDVTPASAPGAPFGVIAMPGDGTVTVTWEAPGDDGGSPITGYVVTALGGATKEASGTSVVFDGLTLGVRYSFTVAAVNAFGKGPDSMASNEAVPVSAPGAPREVVADRGDKNVTLRWLPPASNGGSAISHYVVQCSDGREPQLSGGTEFYVDELVNGTAYTFSVYAVNAAGPGPSSATASPVVPATVPDAPTDVTVTQGDRSLTVTWVAPEWDGGSPITGFIVAVGVDVEHTVDATKRSLTLRAPADDSGLILGWSYSFTVVAVNDVGGGQPSLPTADYEVISRPSTPQLVTAERGDRQATVSWQPSFGNGSTVSGYLVKVSDGAEYDAPSTPYVVENLLNGVAYTFTVTALSEELGASDPSDPSLPVTPAGVPFAPTLVTATGDRGAADVSWTVPDDNGSAIEGYRVSANGGAFETVQGTSRRFTNLTNGTPYSFVVQAFNDVGDGAVSDASAEVVPKAEPTTPLDLTVERKVGAPSVVVVKWKAPASDEGSPITRYVLTDRYAKTYDVTGLSLELAGLVLGKPYSFTAKACNAIGCGPQTIDSNEVTPLDKPGAPLNVVALSQAGAVFVSWEAPTSDGGAPVNGWSVTSSAGATYTPELGPVGVYLTSVRIEGLTNGTYYTFTVKAQNEIGFGPGSTSASVKAVDFPKPPTDPRVEIEDTGLRVSWTESADKGGEDVTYHVTLDDGVEPFSASTTGTTVHIADLSDGTSYVASIEARSIVGSSAAAVAPAVKYRDREWAQWSIPSVGDLSYTASADTVKDDRTGLIWQRDPAPSTMAWAAANAYCLGLSVGDYSDWRLPTLVELGSLVDFSKSAPAIDATAFRGVFDATAGRYWTATTYTPTSANAWIRSFHDGSRGNLAKTSSLSVRCVR